MANRSKEIGKPEAIDLIYSEIIKIYEANNTKKVSKPKKENKELENNNVDSGKKEDTQNEGKVIGIKKK